MPWVKIIVLSGHDEFSYAKEALTIGVTDYLLKPISSSDLMKTLIKVASQIESEKLEMENAEILKKQLVNNLTLFRDKFLNELALGMIPSVQAIEKSQHFNINIISKYYLVEIIEPEIDKKVDSNDRYSESAKMDTLMAGILNNNSEVISFKRNIEETILIIKGDNAANIEESAYALAQSIKYEVERNTDFHLNIGIGSVHERIQGIVDSFKEADTAKNLKHYIGKGKIIGIKDIVVDSVSTKNLLKFDKANITEFLKYGVKANIQDFFEQYLNPLTESDLKSLIYCYYAFMDIVLAATKYIEEIGGKVEKLIPEISNTKSFIDSINSLEQFKKYICKVVEDIIEYRDSKVESKYSNIIRRAKEYIDENYSCPDISLNSVAAHVNMSSSHFSTVFSQYTEETFIEYLTKTRIKIAMELLRTTQKRSSEVAYEVGYNDPHYFSYLFKKTTGITPRDFRYDS
jgi:two-component system response regulator YesN